MHANRILSRVATLCAAGLFCTVAQAAIVFDFSWTGNPAHDPGLTTSEDASAAVTGFIELDVGAGDNFGISDVLSASFTLSSDLVADIVFDRTHIAFLAGTVAADGLSAALTDLYLDAGNPPAFGCGFPDCSLVNALGRDDYHIVFYFATDERIAFTYASTAAAQASFRLTADPGTTPVPLPGTAALALAGLAAAGLARRRQPAGG